MKKFDQSRSLGCAYWLVVTHVHLCQVLLCELVLNAVPLLIGMGWPHLAGSCCHRVWAILCTLDNAVVY
eukprot:m.18900 g.18900  ORF g.18900 m.18900 type:complete len:69 (+) comp7959_c0_seq1:732-938(+)